MSIEESWENKPKLSDLKNDYSNAKIFHDAQMLKVDTWANYRNITGKIKRKKVVGKSSIVPKLIRKQAEWRYASLSEPFLSTEDIFNGEPVTFEDKKAAIQNILVLNNQFNTKINKTKFINDSVKALVNDGTVIWKAGWDYQDKEITINKPIYRFVPTNDPAITQQYEELAKALQDDPSIKENIDEGSIQAIEKTVQTGIPVIAEQIGVEEVVETKVLINQPTVKVCDIHNVIVDPTAKGDLKKADFIIDLISTSIAELSEDSKYSNLDKINVEGNTVLSLPDNQEKHDFEFDDKPRKKIMVFEYTGNWDINGDGKTVPIIVSWVGDTIIRMEENPLPDKIMPYASAQYLDVIDSNYGEPDAELLKDNQDISGAVMRGMIDSMGKSANGQIGMASNMLDVTNKRRFIRGQDYEFNPSQHPSQGIIEHKFAEIPRSALEMINLQNNEAESLTGVKAFSQGIGSQSLGSTATGIRSALDATSKRELGILRRLSAGLIEVGRMIVAMNSEFLSEEEVIRVTNKEFVKIRRDDLKGDFDLSLSISTAEADNDKAQELAFMLQTMGQTLDAGMTKIVLADIARLRKMPLLAKKFEEFEPQPDPLEEERKQLEVELLKAQIANEQAKANENNANAALDNSKAVLNQSQADKYDLDFIEQSEGVGQERELEKQDRRHANDMRIKEAEAYIQQNNTAQEQRQNGN